MKNNIIFGILTILFFVVYWNIVQWIWNRWMPINPITDVLAIFIVVIVNIPLSVISADYTIKIIEES